MDEGLGHCERRMIGSVDNQLAADMPASVAVKPALAIKGCRGRSGMCRKRDSMQSHGFSHDIAVGDAVEDGFDFSSPGIGVEQVDRLDAVECRRRCTEPFSDRLIG